MTRLTCRALILTLVTTLAMPIGAAERPSTATPAVRLPGVTHIQRVAGIDEYRLDSNGLAILLKPDHSVPVAALDVTYRVGSRNEVTGTTGATHILEHLMFKGSKDFNRENGKGIWQFLENVGAVNNATTSLDRTNYWEVFGTEHLALVLQMEADRMRNLLLREEDRQAEMTVVRNEYERGERGRGRGHGHGDND